MTITINDKKVPKKCRVTSCKHPRCSVGLNGFNSPLIIDMDCKELGLSHQTRCDYLFLVKKNKISLVSPIELKGGGIGSLTLLKNQLQKGADFALEILPENPDVNLVPVLVYGTIGNKHKREKIRGVKIKFNGKKYGIRIIQCGGQLNKVL